MVKGGNRRDGVVGQGSQLGLAQRGPYTIEVGRISQLELMLKRWPEVQMAGKGRQLTCGKSDHRPNGVVLW